jgi:glycosyltransferase involved in cell wall biosynthesis
LTIAGGGNLVTEENAISQNIVDTNSSIIIPTIKEREKDLLELLHHITNQIVKPCEVIVVDGRKIKIPREIIEKYQQLGIRLVLIKVSPKLTLGAYRNVGIKKAKAKYICFLDDDVLPTRGWLLEIKKSLELGTDIVGGVSKPLFRSMVKAPLWWDEALIGPYVAVGNQYIKFKHDGIWGCNFAINKKAIKKIGYFDEDLGLRKAVPKLLDEDSEFVRRAVRNGLSVQLNPYAMVYHKLDVKRINLGDIRIRAFQQGLTMKELIKKYDAYTDVTFLKKMLFKAFRGPYFVLMRKSNAVALPIYMILLVYEIMGWLGVFSNRFTQ